MQNSAKEQVGALEKSLAEVYANAPHLPEGVRKVLVDFAPWVVLIVGILGLIGAVPAILGSIAIAFVTLGAGTWVLISALGWLAISILYLMAFSPLKAHKKSGWNKIFYASIISLLVSVVGAFFGGISGLVGGLIGAAIGFYFLFEVRGSYNA